MHRFLFCLLLIAGLAAAPARAQQADTTGTPLPDIAPREVEILGQLEIALPALERQPLMGFNAPPPVPPLPPEHRPFVETYKQETQTLAGGLPAQDDAPRLVRPPAPVTGEIEGGVGRYFSRFGHVAASRPVSERERLSLQLRYAGVSSYAPFDDAAIETPYDAFEGGFGFEMRRDRFAAGFDFGGFADAYTLYGARLGPGYDGGRYAAQPDRQGRGGSGAVWLRTRGAALPAEAHVRYDEATYETALAPDDEVPTLRTERRLSFDAEARPRLGERRLTADLALALSGVADHVPGTDGVAVDAGVETTLRSDAAYTIRAGVRAMGYRASAASRSAEGDRQRLYAFPSLRIDGRLSPTLHVYAQSTPGVEAHALADLFEENPYLVSQPALQPTIRLVDAEGGARLTAGPVQLIARGGYRYMPGYLYFEPGESHVPYRRGFFAARYEPAQVVHGGLDLTLPSYRGINTAVGVSVREGRLIDSEAAIPYFAPVTAHASLTYALPGEQGLLQATALYESTRPTDRTGETHVGAFFDLDVEGAYRVTPAISVVGRLENLSNALERWANYPHPPLLVGLGMRITF